MVKVAINGFGRIGRNTLRAAIREGIIKHPIRRGTRYPSKQVFGD